MTRSQKILTSSFTLFIFSIIGFQLCVFLRPTLWPLLLDSAFGFSVALLVPRAGFRFLGWLAPPLLVAFLCANPRALFGGSGEAHGWAMLALIELVVFGLAASGVGTLFGFFVRRFVTT